MPMSANPIAAGITYGNNAAIKNPAERQHPLKISTLNIPNLEINRSPINLPAAIVTMNDIYPEVVNDFCAFTTFVKKTTLQSNIAPSHNIAQNAINPSNRRYRSGLTKKGRLESVTVKVVFFPIKKIERAITINAIPRK